MSAESRSPSLWFRPWRWPRRVWVAVLPLALAAYLLSASPVIFCIYQCGLEKNGLVVNTVRVVYFPISLLEDKSETFHRLLRWEIATMVRLFGESSE